MERDGISAIQFEAARLHFLSDVLVAVAVVVAVVPFCAVGKLWRGKKEAREGRWGGEIAFFLFPSSLTHFPFNIMSFIYNQYNS